MSKQDGWDFASSSLFTGASSSKINHHLSQRKKISDGQAARNSSQHPTSGHHCPSSQSHPRSAQSVQRTVRPSSHPNTASCSMLPSGDTHCNTSDLSALSLPVAVQPWKTCAFQYGKMSDPPQQEMLIDSNGDSNFNSHSSAHFSTFEHLLNMMPTENQFDKKGENSGPKNESDLARERDLRNDMAGVDLDVQPVEGRPGFLLDDSAIRLLQCNNFISRVSSMCGKYAFLWRV